jgi:natural product precursor
MKKLRKLNLKSATLMDDNEMKMIVGGSGTNDCPKGRSETGCAKSCTVYAEYNGQGVLRSGTCHYSGIGDICACVVS